jgi:hypothetical protein
MAAQTEHILTAFQSLVDAEPTISIISADGDRVHVSCHLLTIFSPMLRNCFASQNPCVHPTILLPEFSTSDVQHLLNIFSSGESQFGLDMMTDLKGVTELAKTLQIEMFSLDQFQGEREAKVEQIKMECFDEDKDCYDDDGFGEFGDMKEEFKGKVRTKQETSEETKALNRQRTERAQTVRKECLEMEITMANNPETIRLYNKIIGRSSCQYKKEKETEEHFEKRAASWHKYPGIIYEGEISKFTVCVHCGKVFFNLPSNHQCKSKVDYLKNKLVEVVKDWKYNEDVYDTHFTQVHVDNIECNHCKMLFMHISNFKDHMTEQHADSVNNKKHICAECGRGFGRSRILKQHELTQHGKEFDDAHTCSECGMMFILKSKLEHHMRNKHGNERPYICDLCAKTFKQKEHLTRHYLLHSGDKSWPCRHCDKTFARSWTRTQHENIHIGNKPYKCDQCEVSFTQKNSLDCHMKSNHS